MQSLTDTERSSLYWSRLFIDSESEFVVCKKHYIANL